MRRPVIKHKAVTAADLQEGELAVDPAGELQTVTLRGRVSAPLDRAALAPRNENASAETYLYQTSGVAEIGLLEGGSGGVDRDPAPWRIPGFTPQGVSSRVLGENLRAPLRIGAVTPTTRFRVRVLAGSGEVLVNIWRKGLIFYSRTLFAPSPMAVSVPVIVTFDPGHYELEVHAPGLELETLTGYVDWTPGLIHHPVLFGVN